MSVKSRYASAVVRANELHHSVRIVVFQGHPKPGELVRFMPLRAVQADTLDEALTIVEEYLESPEAEESGALLAERKELDDAQAELQVKLRAVQSDMDKVEDALSESASSHLDRLRLSV